MTGDEHYWQAEYCLNAIRGLHSRRLRKYRAEMIAKAQVHATLALASASATVTWAAERNAQEEPTP